MNTANWLQLLGTIVLLAVTWGGVQARLKQVEKQSEKTSDDLNKSRSDQGGRIGILADRLKGGERRGDKLRQWCRLEKGLQRVLNGVPERSGLRQRLPPQTNGYLGGSIFTSAHHTRTLKTSEAVRAR